MHERKAAAETEAKTASVKSASRVLDLLEYLGAAEAAVRLSDITLDLGFPKSSCLMLLRTLTDRGYVDRDDHGHYQLGALYKESGSWVSGRFAMLRDIALPEIEALSQHIGQTAVLGVLTSRPDIRVIASVPSRADIRYEIPLGTRFPLFCSAMGRCALAFGGELFRERYLELHPRPQLTPHTVTDLAKLREIIDQVRQERVAINVEEHVIGAISVAAPVLDRTGSFIGTINVGCVAPTFNADSTKIERAVYETGLAISRRVQNC